MQLPNRGNNDSQTSLKWTKGILDFRIQKPLQNRCHAHQSVEDLRNTGFTNPVLTRIVDFEMTLT